MKEKPKMYDITVYSKSDRIVTVKIDNVTIEELLECIREQFYDVIDLGISIKESREDSEDKWAIMIQI